MRYLAITSSFASLFTLFVGLYAWRLTNSRSVAFNTLLSAAGLLLAAGLAESQRQPELSCAIPFMVFALFAGRAIGFGYRSRKETELRLPAMLLGAVSIVALMQAALAFAAE